MTHVGGNLYKVAVGKGRFRYFYRRSITVFENGKRIEKDVKRRLGHSMDWAVAEAAKLDADCDLRKQGRQPVRGLTLVSLAEWYKNRMINSGKRSWKIRWGHIRPLVEAMGDVPPGRLTRADMVNYRAKLLGRGLDNDTVNTVIRDVKGMFNAALDEGFVRFNPTDRIKPLEQTLRPFTVPSREQVERLIEACPPWLARIVTVLATTGLRPSDILHLDYSSIHLDRAVITLKQRKTGKWITVPIPKRLEREIWRWSEGGILPVSGLVFPNVGRGNRAYSIGGAYSRFKRTACRLGMEWMTLDLFRKLVATEIKRRKGLEVAARQLGHGNSRTTSTHYIVETPEDTGDAKEALNDFWSDPGPESGTISGHMGDRAVEEKSG